MKNSKLIFLEIARSLKNNDFVGGVASIHRIQDLKNHVGNFHIRKQFDETFYNDASEIKAFFTTSHRFPIIN